MTADAEHFFTSPFIYLLWRNICSNSYLRPTHPACDNHGRHFWKKRYTEGSIAILKPRWANVESSLLRSSKAGYNILCSLAPPSRGGGFDSAFVSSFVFRELVCVCSFPGAPSLQKHFGGPVAPFHFHLSFWSKSSDFASIVFSEPL